MAAEASLPSPAPGPVGHTVIPIVNKLQDIFAQLGAGSTIDLPQVAVVGSQSSGKSSVLEALVGRDFLPRGTDICTRRPLVLQLVHTPRTSTEDRGDGPGAEWGEFLHVRGKRFYDFDEIRREIQDETDKEAGINKGVSEKQIRLKIFSPYVLNITLVDLPGITKVPVGDQPSDIEARIRTMILSYIKHKTCIILAVSPANADLANSDALKMARIADPDGSRTIGVITKLDIMDRGTDARNFLLGNVIPLKLGYVGVVNRCQQDINSKRSIREALSNEENFFRTHPAYHGLSHCCGVPQLAKKLNQILVQHIRQVLPGLKSRVNAQLVAVAKEFASYGEVAESEAAQGVLLLNILSKYCEAFSSLVDGRNEELSTIELFGGARIHYIFQSIFVKSLEEVDPCEDITDEDIRLAIQNATGPRGSLFVPEVPFEMLVRRQIGRLLDPSLQCARFIYDELIKMSHCCLSSELQRYPFLRKRMDEVISNFLRDHLKPAERMITHIINMEMDYINTSHPSFIGGNKALENAQQQVKSSKAASVPRSKDGMDPQVSDKNALSRIFLSKAVANGATTDHLQGGGRLVSDSDRPGSSDGTVGSSWGIPSIFGYNEDRAPLKESTSSKMTGASVRNPEHSSSFIQLKEPPIILKPSEQPSQQEALEIAITKLLLKSYFDIVRNNVEDSVPKAIMHFLVLYKVIKETLFQNKSSSGRSPFPRWRLKAASSLSGQEKLVKSKDLKLVNQTKRELHNTFIRKLYRENIFKDLLREPDDIASKRKQLRENLKVLQQAYSTLEMIPIEAETVERGYTLDSDPTKLSKVHGLSGSFIGTANDLGSPYAASPKNPRSRKSTPSGEQLSPMIYSYSDANGSG